MSIDWMKNYYRPDCELAVERAQTETRKYSGRVIEQNTTEQTQEKIFALQATIGNSGNPAHDSIFFRVRGKIYVGRSKEALGPNGIVLPVDRTSGISGRHCSISQHSDGVVIEDLGSRNGTSINNRQLEPKRKYLAQNGDTLKVGKIYFDVKEVSA